MKRDVKYKIKKIKYIFYFIVLFIFLNLDFAYPDAKNSEYIKKCNELVLKYRESKPSEFSPKLIFKNKVKGKVIILPFVNKSNNLEADVQVFKAIVDEFRHKGYLVISPVKVMHFVSDIKQLPNNIEELSKVAKLFNVDLIIMGEILHYSHYKTFKIPGALLLGIISAIHKHAEIKLSTWVFDKAKNKIVHEQTLSKHDKEYVLGIIGSTSSMIDYLTAKIVEELYEKF